MLYFDRFDICEAYYLFAANWHSGQWSEEYAIFGRLHRIDFKPSGGLKFNTLTENGQSIYNGLKKRFNCTLIIKKGDK